MKSKSLALLIAALLLMGMMTAAAELVGGEFTDTTATTTEDSVLRFDAAWGDEAHNACNLNVLEPDQLTVDTDIDLFKFVVEEEHAPARYFPEETQQQIAAIVGEDMVDSLYLTEFMRMHAVAGAVQGDVNTRMLMNVDYRPGETILVVLADTRDPANLVWTALPATVTALSQIEFSIPEELMESFMGEDLIFTLLTVSPGKAIFRTETEEVRTEQVIPSIGIKDVVEIRTITTLEGVEQERTFQMAIVNETQKQINELNAMREYVVSQQAPMISWFPTSVQNEIALLVDESVNLNEMVIFDYLPVYTLDYEGTYGDVLVSFSFATPYQEGETIVAVLGLPNSNATGSGTHMNWDVQIARVESEGLVKVAFNQLEMLEMLQEPGLLMLLVESRMP